MKKRILSLIMALVMALSLSLPAMAAETANKGISVQLDGENIAFTDAAPVLVEGRTYLPARAVFEAMGAELVYDAPTQTVTATRDGMKLTMVVGDVNAAIEANGVSVPLVMDVAPFIQNDRTYVPVRFAASAFGCQVGWDQDDQTVVLVDTLKVLEKIKSEYKLTWLEKLEAYQAKMNEGKWAVDGTVKGDITLGANPFVLDSSKEAKTAISLMTLDGTLKGLVEGQSAGQMDVTMKMDMSGLMKLLASATGTTVTEMGLTDADMKQSVAMEVRVDLDSGTMYMKPDASYCKMLGVEEGTWLSMDFSNAMTYSMDMMSTLPSISTSNVVLDNKDTAYQTVTDSLRKVFAAISDDGFKKVSGGYSATIDMTDAFATGAVTVMLNTNSKDEVTGYKMTVNASADMTELKGALGADTVAQFTALGLNMDQLDIAMVMGMDNSNKSTVSMTIELGSTASIKLDAAISYTATTKTVETQPPAGSKVVDLFSLMEAATTPEA
ncbi:MAG: copper amine oxidase N-terminal domain-containing protein [Clostridia bacterium]|nr:copper amine oxidase N-terminal domain-containing protein [Clostridia bacterium]